MSNAYSFRVSRVSTASSQVTTTFTAIQWGLPLWDIGGGWSSPSQWVVPAGLYLVGCFGRFSGVAAAATVYMGIYQGSGASSAGGEFMGTLGSSGTVVDVSGSMLYHLTAADNFEVKCAVSTGTCTLDGASLNAQFWGIRLG